jgi:hypothetical protein
MPLSRHFNLLHQTRQFDQATAVAQSPLSALANPPEAALEAEEASSVRALARGVSVEVANEGKARTKDLLHRQHDLLKDIADTQGILRDEDGNVVSGAQPEQQQGARRVGAKQRKVNTSAAKTEDKRQAKAQSEGTKQVKAAEKRQQRAADLNDSKGPTTATEKRPQTEVGGDRDSNEARAAAGRPSKEAEAAEAKVREEARKNVHDGKSSGGQQ